MASKKDSQGEKLIPPQRRSFILDVLREQGAASIQQLSDRMGASFSTVRRDLDYLAARGLVNRTHGGATLRAPEKSAELTEPVREEDEVPSREVGVIKEAIGEAASHLIDDGDSIIFDSSTTVLEAASAIVARRLKVTAVTNNLRIAGVLGGSSVIRLIVPGGTLRPATFALYGEPGESFLERLHADVALIGGQSVYDGRLTDSRVESASIKRLMMKAARRRVLLIDSWKFGGPGFCEVASLDEFDEVITDDGISDEERAKLERLGVRLTTVPVSEDGPGPAAERFGQRKEPTA